MTKPDLSPAAMALAVRLQLEDATVGNLDEVRRIEPEAAATLVRRHSREDIAALDEAIEPWSGWEAGPGRSMGWSSATSP